MDPHIVENWLKQDPRLNRYSSDELTVDLIIKKTQCLLPTSVVENKRVLDLGAGIPYVELWCNQHNATYTGVEVQKSLADRIKKLISGNSKIYHDSIENFLDNSNLEQYDVIVASSILQDCRNFQKYLEVLLRSQKHLVFEFTDVKEYGSSLGINERVPQPNNIDDPSLCVEKWMPSHGYIKFWLEKYGYELLNKYYDASKKILPGWYGTKKFLIHALPGGNEKLTRFMHENEWSFSGGVVDIFEDHAQNHIPDYEFVLNSIPKILQQHDIKVNDSILDFGCATGKTLRILKYSGFENIHGVDSSQEMLDKCPMGLAELVCGDTVPQKKFKVIIANWTLHFNEDKKTLLEDVLSKLDEGGLLILSEKTSETDQELYHHWKSKQGVSRHEIELKAKSLKGKMHLHDPRWYSEIFAEHDHCVFNKKLGFYTWLVKKH